jgi:hypothetical protein
MSLRAKKNRYEVCTAMSLIYSYSSVHVWIQCSMTSIKKKVEEEKRQVPTRTVAYSSKIRLWGLVR